MAALASGCSSDDPAVGGTVAPSTRATVFDTVIDTVIDTPVDTVIDTVVGTVTEAPALDLPEVTAPIPQGPLAESEFCQAVAGVEQASAVIETVAAGSNPGADTVRAAYEELTRRQAEVFEVIPAELEPSAAGPRGRLQRAAAILGQYDFDLTKAFNDPRMQDLTIDSGSAEALADQRQIDEFVLANCGIDLANA